MLTSLCVCRGAIRSENNPTGDFAEALVAEHYGVELAPNSNAGHDLRQRGGTRVQVMARRRPPRSKPSHYGLMRKLDREPFDVLVAVLFDEEFRVESAFRMPIGIVRELSTFSEHTNAWRLPIIRGDRVRHPGVRRLSPGSS